MDDINFLIPVHIDHPTRLRNLDLCLTYLNKLGITNIFIDNAYTDRFPHPQTEEIIKSHKYGGYVHRDISKDPYYNKMSSINSLLCFYPNRPYLAVYDVDVLITKRDLIEAHRLLTSCEADVVYPYNGYFYDIPAEEVTQLDNHNMNYNINLEKCTLFNRASHGGAVLFNRRIFLDGGACNPNFKNVGYDDDELYLRFYKLGYTIKRTAGPLLHMNHFRGETSFNHSKFLEENRQIVEKVQWMSKQELREYIKTWSKPN